MKIGFAGALIIAAFMLPACYNGRNDDVALIAVATNFRTTFDKLEADFERETEHDITQVNGATGSLYAQILNGAPYHMFLSADQKRPHMLSKTGLVQETDVYAEGVLVLWAKSQDRLSRPVSELLSDPTFAPIAAANPDLAPYGQAAQEVLSSYGTALDERLVSGENVGQAFALVVSGNAVAGFVAGSDAQHYAKGYAVDIDPDRYAPIKQEVALLVSGAEHAAAAAFYDYLFSGAAQMIIAADGYNLPKAPD